LILRGGLSRTRGFLGQDIVTANEIGVISLGHMLAMSLKLK
jgi:hypothetical protein